MVDKTKFFELVGRNKKFPRKNGCSYYTIDNKDNFRGVLEHICHSGVINSSKTIGLKEIVTFFKQGEYTDDYVNHIINSNWLGDCFLTKDVEDGYNNGFFMNVEKPINLIRAALIMIRSPYELPHIGKQFNTLKKWGWDLDDCLYFSFSTHFMNDSIEPYGAVHGKCVSYNTSRLDVVNGIRYTLTTPANVCSYYSEVHGYVDISLYDVDNPSTLLLKSIDKHPNRKKEENCFGGEICKIKFTKKNMEILKEIYKDLEKS